MKKIKDLKENIEEFLDSDSKYATPTKVVLAILAISGIVFTVAVAPNVFQILGKYKKSKRYSQKQISNAYGSLKRMGFIEVVKEDGDKIKVKLTNKGRERIKEFSVDALAIPRPAHWDKKWRIVIFDIPNKFTRARNALRIKLQELGFYQLQKSVWVYPYDCEDEILFIANFFKVERFVEILTVEKLLHGNKVKQIFLNKLK